MEEFMFVFDTTLAPIVGQQITYTGPADVEAVTRLELFISRALSVFTLIGMPDSTECDVIAKGRLSGESRGWVLSKESGTFVSDLSADPELTKDQLLSLFDAEGESVTFTCAPTGSWISNGRRSR